MSIGAMSILRRVERTLRRINADSESAIAINVPQKLGHSRETNRGASGDQQGKLAGVVRIRAARKCGLAESARAANDAEQFSLPGQRTLFRLNAGHALVVRDTHWIRELCSSQRLSALQATARIIPVYPLYSTHRSIERCVLQQPQR